jgi:hypothetical protein
MSVRRRSVPPDEETPKTWVQIIFFPLSIIAMSLMLAMLLIYGYWTWLASLAAQEGRERAQPTALRPSAGTYTGPQSTEEWKPAKTEKRTAGGIVIEK